MWARLRSLVRALTSRCDFEAGMTEELRFHIEEYTEDLVRSGVSVEEARRRARRCGSVGRRCVRLPHRRSGGQRSGSAQSTPASLR